MSYLFPQFQEPNTINPQRSWTAVFDSYDQRKENCYYAVTMHEAGREAARFMVVVGTEWAGDDWTAPDFVARLRQEIHQIAVTGKTNTPYQGYGFSSVLH